MLAKQTEQQTRVQAKQTERWSSRLGYWTGVQCKQSRSGYWTKVQAEQTEEYTETERQTRVLDWGAREADPGATDCKLTLTALHHMGANDDLLRPQTFTSFTPQILSGEKGDKGWV